MPVTYNKIQLSISSLLIRTVSHNQRSKVQKQEVLLFGKICSLTSLASIFGALEVYRKVNIVARILYLQQLGGGVEKSCYIIKGCQDLSWLYMKDRNKLVYMEIMVARRNPN
ncbi:hypothetical protein HZH68_007690 [Vespula germanica]|uniref:Uncharacterized protein n=1 Tax=Vespula germanica TaxID=30212 RepID=A0A834K2J9_VESGE|nr:hypothetical protein HZH68_007690 [Vespula germanica]